MKEAGSAIVSLVMPKELDHSAAELLDRKDPAALVTRPDQGQKPKIVDMSNQG